MSGYFTLMDKEKVKMVLLIGAVFLSKMSKRSIGRKEQTPGSTQEGEVTAALEG